MQQPRTPSKAKRAEEIEKADKVTRIVNELSSNWGLQFPIRDVTWSPSKIPKQKPASEDAFGRIKFLCSYRNKPALDYTLKHFDEVATRICSQWVPKPYAERDVTPRRIDTRGSSRSDAIHRRSNIDLQTANELMEELLAIVSQITNCVKAGADYRIFDEGFFYPNLDMIVF